MKKLVKKEAQNPFWWNRPVGPTWKPEF